MSSSEKKVRRRRRKSGLVEITNGFLSILVLGLLGAGAALLFLVQQFYSEGPVKTETHFLVDRGSSLRLVAERLENQGLISNRYVFQFGGWAMKKQGQLKPGEFVLPANASMADIVKLLTEGKPIEYFVTVPEGITSWQVAQRINDPANSLSGDPVPVPPEGSVLPGRYDYFPLDTRQSVLEAMQAKMKETVTAVWDKRSSDLPLKTPAELVTLASIVEKETGVPTERPKVAGLFVNRLKKGMRLQTDPTIIYGITKGEGQLAGGITQSQKEQRTPYNTYQVDGLPPTPIANPGIESLEAVAQPETTGDLYMMAVSLNPDDGHLFAKTLEEHRKNEAKYRALERDAAAAARAAPAGETPPAADATPPATDAAPAAAE